MGFPTDMFPVLFAIPRVSGWLSHWVEEMDDKKGKIWRPRQVYSGHGKRSFVSMEDRGEAKNIDTSYKPHPMWRRSRAAAKAKL